MMREAKSREFYWIIARANGHRYMFSPAIGSPKVKDTFWTYYGREIASETVVYARRGSAKVASRTMYLDPQFLKESGYVEDQNQ